MTRKKDEDLDVVFLDEVLGQLEARLGVELLAVDEDDVDDLVYGLELLERLQAEGARDPAGTVPLEDVRLTADEWALLERTEAEYGIRLIAYHQGADAVLYGGAVIDDAKAQYGLD